MIEIPAVRSFGRLPRRDFVRVGGLTAFTLAGSWQRANAVTQSGTKQAKSCILIWLDGGPSHLDTFDPKPEAPAEVRGPFGTIATSVAGVRFSELLPRSAAVMKHLAVIRSMTSPLGEHGLANQYLLTGYQPTPVLRHPSFGAVISQARPESDTSMLPPYVAIPESRSMGAGFLGPAHEPFIANGDPAHRDFRVRDLDFYPDLDADRVRRRSGFLAELNRVQASLQQSEQGGTTFDTSFQKAYRLVTSPAAKAAFDLATEPERVRSRYGTRTLGQSCLLARRLIERGVNLVTVTNTGWDTHAQLSLQLRDGYAGAQVGVGLVPTFDHAFAALIEDLSDRNLLNDTLVIAMGEFGRTPKINTAAGRDHWPRVFSVVLAGGGVQGGQVIGASDRVGESPTDHAVSPNDLANTIYRLLGINPDQELLTRDGRPVPINQGGRFIRQVVTG